MFADEIGLGNVHDNAGQRSNQYQFMDLRCQLQHLQSTSLCDTWQDFNEWIHQVHPVVIAEVQLNKDSSNSTCNEMWKNFGNVRPQSSSNCWFALFP